jgi:septum site-determining protein MinC
MINIKGSRDGLRIIIHSDALWDDALTALTTKLEQSSNFFAGATIIVEIGERHITDEQLNALLTLMRQCGMQPEAVATSCRESRSVIRGAGLTVRHMPIAHHAQTGAPDCDTTLLQRTVRSGQIVRHESNITLIGDVNPGAELIAGGSIVVWGRLRGLVHAGALGNKHAIVCALDLRPTQLRIADLIARTPDEQSHTILPEVALIQNDTIVVETWEAYKRG